MIRLDGVRVTYPGAALPALTTPDIRITEGQLVLVVGPTGSGKSTFLRALNGLVPHFSGGHLSGRVVVDGRDTASFRPRDLADVVALVAQNPAASFVTDRVEDEIAYGMELLSVGATVMRRRVEETLDLLGLASIRDRSLATLSGGQQQRVAIAAVLAARPHVLVLDEPTSALDPVAAEEVLSALHRLVHDIGLTVVLAEHRLERVIHHADAIVLIDGGRASALLDPSEAMAVSPVFPPVIALGRYAGWSPLPLSVRTARTAAGPLRERLAAAVARVDAGATRSAADTGAAGTRGTGTGAAGVDGAGKAGTGTGGTGVAGTGDARTIDTGADGEASRETEASGRRTPWWSRFAPRHDGAERADSAEPPAIEVSALTLWRGETRALDEVTLRARGGDIVAVMGRNGSGKSSLLWTLAGQFRCDEGRVRIDGHDPAALAPDRRRRHVALVPQDPSDLLFALTVGEECVDADAETGVAPGSCAALLSRLAGPIDPARHPRDLSEGQRLALALAVVLVARPPVLLLDEPTRGLDYPAKAQLLRIVRELAAAGTCVVLATHDVELAAEAATRVLLLADGALVADDPSAQVLADSTAYAPQVARVLHPVPVLTVSDVAKALAGVPGGVAVPAEVPL